LQKQTPLISLGLDLWFL